MPGRKIDDPPPPYTPTIIPRTSIPGEVPDPDLSLQTKLVAQSRETQTALIKIQPTRGVVRSPVHICCVVDISGSMGDEATFKNEEGASESDGLNILDLVKHSIRTILSTMTPADKLSIVSFTTGALLQLAPTSMNAQGKLKAEETLQRMHPEAQTNLWGGLQLGLDTVRTAQAPSSENSISSVFIFTDGMPNVVPPRGHMAMIQQYKDSHGLPCSVNTFGFGYQLESDLLDEIARACDGSYVFIPDSSFVGTAFINATANLYTVLAKDVTLRVEVPTEVKIDVVGGHPVVDASWGKSIRIGNVHFDQPRDIILNVSHPSQTRPRDELLQIVLDYTLLAEPKPKKKSSTVLASSVIASEKEVGRHLLRSRFVDAVDKAVKAITKDQEMQADILAKQLQNIVHAVRLEGGVASDDQGVVDLLKDVNSQVAEAIQVAYYHRWGKHYLPSLADAHRAQHCNNFKDPGVQGFGGPLFNALRLDFDEIFVKLPPPKPSRTGTRSGPVNMSMYYNQRGPCFHGDSTVSLEGTPGSKNVSEVGKGDRVNTISGTTATVTCVVKTGIHEGVAGLVKFPSGLLVTPYHPIFDSTSSEWKFPIDLYKAEPTPCDAIYSFVVEGEQSMIINGIPCVTLGHGATGDVREHPYFGTNLVLDDLKRNRGWESGRVNCKGVERDVQTGLVCGFIL